MKVACIDFDCLSALTHLAELEATQQQVAQHRYVRAALGILARDLELYRAHAARQQPTARAHHVWLEPFDVNFEHAHASIFTRGCAKGATAHVSPRSAQEVV